MIQAASRSILLRDKRAIIFRDVGYIGELGQDRNFLDKGDVAVPEASGPERTTMVSLRGFLGRLSCSND